MRSIIFCVWLLFVPNIFCEPDVHLVFQSTLSRPSSPFNRRFYGQEVDFKHQKTFEGRAKVVRFSERTFENRAAFQKKVDPYIKNSSIERLFFERLGDEYVALLNVKECIHSGGWVYIEPSLNSRDVFYDSHTMWCPDIQEDQYLMPTMVLFSECQDVGHSDITYKIMTQIFWALLDQDCEDFQNISDEAAFETIYGSLEDDTVVDQATLKKGVGARAKSLRVLFEKGITMSSTQLGKTVEDLKLELKNSCVAHGVQNLWSFILQNGYMQTQRDAIKRHIEKMGFKNVSIVCGQNPFNGRKNSWLISAQKS